MGLQSVLERRLMEERKNDRNRTSGLSGERKSREHQETSYFGDNRQAVLEDFFSSEEEEGEKRAGESCLGRNGAGNYRSFVVCTGRVCCSGICSTISGNLGSIRCDGGINCSDLAGGCEKRKKEERQIEEQFAIYQGTSEEAPRHSKTDIREWEEKDKEPEAEEITWEKRIPWGGDTYTQILSNGGEQGGLILKELHPVSGRQFRIEKATRLTIIGQLERTGRSCPAIHSSKPGPCQYRTTGR